MAEETIWILGIDGESALSTLDAIDAALAAVLESMNNVSDAASGLSSIDAALSTVATSSDEAVTGVESLDEALSTTTATADGLDEALAQLQGTINEDTAIIDGLNEALANTQAQLDMLTASEAEAEAASTSLGDAIQAAQGQLMMLGMAGVMMGKSIFDAGVQGQQGIALVQGMAGASNQDIQNLEQSALQLGDSMDQASAGFYQVASAGYQGADATKVFTAATEAAKGSQSSLQPVTTALTSIMAAYGEGADQAKTTTDQMIETVLVGKQSFEAFASAIGPLAATGHNVGLSFAEVAAAEATMTQINPNVRQDTMQLNSLFTNMDMSMEKVANTAKKLKIPFDEAHYASLNLIDKLKYLADVSGGTNTVAFQKMVGGVNGVKAALALLSNQGDTYTTDLQKIQNSQGATDAAFGRSEQTIQAHMDHMGAAFSVFSTKFMDAVGPHLIPVLDNLGKAIDFLSQHMDIAIPIVSGLAVVLGGVLVAALWAMLTPLLAITVSVGALELPFIAIAAIVGAVVAVVVLAIMHWGQIVSWLQGVWSAFSSWFMGMLGATGSFFVGLWGGIASFFVGLWGGIVSFFQGVWNGIASFLQGAWNVIVAIVRVGGQLLYYAVFGPILAIVAAFEWLYNHNYYFKALIDTIVNIFKAGFAWLTDQWKGFTTWLAGVWEGTVATASSVWNAVSAAIMSVVNAVVSWLRSAWQAAISWLGSVWSTMSGLASQAWNGVVSVFQGVWGSISGALSSLWSSISGWFSNLASQAASWGSNVIQGFVNGIEGMLGSVGQAASDVASKVASFLGFHSPTEEGPGAQADKWGPAFIDMFAAGIESRQGHLQSAIQNAASTLAGSFNPQLSSSLSVATIPSVGGNDQSIQYLAQIAMYLAQMLQLQQQRQGNLTMNNNIGTGSINPQALNQLVQALSGWGYESVQRGGI